VPKRNCITQPGVVPEVDQTAGTMFVALYGNLVRHPWRKSEQDADALFYHRSLAMGWLDDRSTGQADSAPGLWAMNDAGWGHPRGVETELVAWFQVEASAVAHDRPLPVQPFLRCAHDAIARAGTLHLSAIQILLPVQGINTDARPPYAPVPATREAPWFAGGDPNARRPVQVSINSGLDPIVPAVAQQLTDQLAGLHQGMLANLSLAVAARQAVPVPPFDDSFWNGPPVHGVVLHGDLVEWSCDVVGWLGALVADSAARLGVRSPLLFTVKRTTSTG
jgi:hypothetical protein